MVHRMATVAAAILLVLAGSGPDGVDGAPAAFRPFEPSDPLGALVGETDSTADVARVMQLFRTTPMQFPMRGMLQPVRLAFTQPFALPEIARHATAPVADAALDAAHPYRAVAAWAARALGAAVPAGQGQGTLEVSDPQRAIFALDFLLNEPLLTVRRALSDAKVDPATPATAKALLEGTGQSMDRQRKRPEALLAAMRAAAQIDRTALVAAVAHLDATLDVKGDWSAMPADELPEALKGAVTGTVLATQEVPELGWLVVGGTGGNTYDMTRVAAVFDAGGDDAYEWRATVAGGRLVVDRAGNDAYRTLPDAGPGGPGGAMCGISVIDDAAGNDTYECGDAAIGAGLLGIGLVVDRAGDDRYRGNAWSVGAAMGGIGALVDLGGSDEYVTDTFSQACGGPSGAALLLDAAGNDRYRADGTAPSAYATPTVHESFSQGCGFGYRIGAPGGIGALVDLSGNDRYECGEFGQGIGYYLSMGILRDGSGNDLYYGNRYAQGTAAHQAFGALLEDGGDDIYWSMTAAGQGAAWDISVAALVDAAGDDRYQADGLSQGAAAQQAIGLLLDAAGNDDYRAAGASQGSADGNQYHWETTRTRSVGILIDRTGTDRWSTPGRGPGQRVRTGRAEEADGRTQWGFFLSR